MAGQGEYHMTFYARVTSYSTRQDLDVVIRELTRPSFRSGARATCVPSYFRSGNYTFCTRPPINNYTNGIAPDASQRRLSSPLFLLCLQPSISSALNNNWYCRLEGGFVRTQRTPPGSAPDCYYDGCARPMIQ